MGGGGGGGGGGGASGYATHHSRLSATPTPRPTPPRPSPRSLKLNASRQVTGVLRGFDIFMNVVVDDATEDVSPTEKARLGMVVRSAGAGASVGAAG